MLLECIQTYPPGHRLFHRSDADTIHAAEFGALAAEWRRHPLLHSLAGHRVAIRAGDPIVFAALLATLDGFAAEILLLAYDLPTEAGDRLVVRAGSEFLVSEGSTGVTSGEGAGRLPFFGSAVAIACVPLSPGEPVGLPKPGGETRWLLATSGTTREPKLVAHTLRSLTRTVKRDLDQGQRFTWGLLYDPARFAGLQVLLQNLMGGSALVLGKTGATLTDLLSEFVLHRCNALSATPTLWRKILMTPGHERLALKQITLGGEIADQVVLDALAVRFPAARIVHIYASTEAGVGFSVKDGREGFPASFLQTGLPGVDLKVDETGLLWLRPALADQEYIGEREDLRAAGGLINTGDCVEIRGDRVYFLGRASGAINVGGNKVQPEEIERILLSHPRVSFVSVYGRPSAMVGALVEAQVVLHDPAKPEPGLAAELRQFCAARLPAYKVPALLRFVAVITTSGAGKLSRPSSAAAHEQPQP